MAPGYLGIAILGLALLVGGFWRAQVSARRWVKLAGPLVAVVGLLAFFLGVLLTTVPGFFS
ncbi:MAG: hypothetical protein GF399_06815 [Candidatus Coatesbacteria bacterium]|nr:hypothetical protein [Candidatus Coatesbacteria bacterium]